MADALFRSAPGVWGWLFQFIGNTFERIRGPRVLKEITRPRAQLESLTGHSTAGYVTVIYCQERRYLCTYTRWGALSRVITTYTVFSKIEGKAPAELVKVCAMERTFPALVHPWSTPFHKKRAAIEAYLDLILAEARAVENK